jgi:outer membrane lipoprotein-sorting protein
MNIDDEQTQAELLDRLLDGRDNDRAPDELQPPELAAFARQVIAMQRNTGSAASERDAQARVWVRVQAAAGQSVPAQPRTLGWRWPVWGRLAFALLVVALVSVFIVRNQPQPVEARAVLERAQAAMALSTNNLSSFAFTQTITIQPDDGQPKTVTTNLRWYQAPNLWHSEDESITYSPDGQPLPDQTWHDTTVSDGVDMWSYDSLRHEVIVNRLNATVEFSSTSFLFGTNVTSLDAFLKPDTTCPDARIMPEPRYLARDEVAGRPTYVIDLGRLDCPSAPGMNGRRVIWVDQETFFILRNELHRLSDDHVVSTIEVTRIQYNVPLDPALFAFTSPANAKVLDLRNRITPTPRAEK